MSAPSPARWLALAALLCARPAAADIAPSETFFSPAPAPLHMPRREADAPPDAGPRDVALLEVSAELDLYPTVALVRASAVVQSPTGGPRRLAIPQLTPFLRAAPITGLEVLVDGRPVAPELFAAPGRPPTSTNTRSREEEWWTWSVELPAGAPVRIELRHTQALSEPDVRHERLHLYAFHSAGDAAFQTTPLRAVAFTLRLHGLAQALVDPRPAPTTATADELVWRRQDLAPADATLGAIVELPLASLPGRDVPRAAYFPADAPAHLVLQDYVARFALVCAPPTPDEWEQLVGVLRDAERSEHPLARSWAAATLRDVGRWCDSDVGEAMIDLFKEPPGVAQCKQWLAVTTPGAEPSLHTLAPPRWCWGESGQAEDNLRRAAERARWRIVLWGGGFAVLAAAAAIALWRRRRG